MLIFCGGMLAGQICFCEETSPTTERQVKALCLLNFAKYVEWPEQVFADASSPIVIGIVGENKFQDDLKDVMADKRVGGRKIVVKAVASDNDYRKCQILFIGAADTRQEADILKGLKSLPMLTVGETEQFVEDGGMINFTTKEGKVRFDVDLNAAHSVGLGISSKLLSLAETVKGKP